MPLQYAALNDRACIEARGAEAAAFLHGQLSQALLDLRAGDAPLAGWADARGRVRALLRVCRLPDRWLLVTPRAGADELVRKLRTYVLRSKIVLARATDVEVGALLGDAGTLLGPDSTHVNRMVHRDDIWFVCVGEGYWQALGPPPALARLGAAFKPSDEASATLAEIRLGLPAIVPETAERYVAQMLNLDALGAVSFAKGCFPGQEIIARVRNLGGVKRRARRYAAPCGPPVPGTPVLTADEKIAGEVVRAAPTDSGCELLAVVEHAAAGGALTCAGGPLTELPLPFAVPLD